MTEQSVMLSDEDSALDAFCLAHGTRLWLLEETLRGMANETPGKSEVERRLRRMRKSFGGNNLDAAEGWLYAVIDGIKAIGTWLPKTKGKLKQEETLKGVQAAGTAANAKASANKHLTLETAVDEYCAPLKQSTWSPAGCLTWIKQRETYYQGGKYCGYARSTAERYIRTILEKRKSH